MADASTISVLIQAKDMASQAFQSVSNNAGKMAAGFEKHRKTIGVSMTAAGGAITGLAALSIKSSLDQQKGINLLDTALKNVGSSYASNREEIERNITAIQRKTNYGDEEQRKILTKLVGIIGDEEQALKALPVVLDAAAFSGKEAGTVSETLSKFLGGLANTSDATGVKVDALATFEERLAAVMAVTSGSAEAAADPFTQLMNTTGDLQQVIGDALLPVLETLVPMIDTMVQRIQDWTAAHPELTKILVIVGAALGAVMLVLGPMLLILPTLATGLGVFKVAIMGVNTAMRANPIGALVAVLTTLALIVLPLVIKHWDAIWDGIQKTTETVVNVVIKIINGMTIVWRKQMGLIVDLVRLAMDKLPDVIKAIIPGFDEVKSALDTVSDKLKEGIPTIDFYNEKQEEIAQQSEATADAVTVHAAEQQLAVEQTTENLATNLAKEKALLAERALQDERLTDLLADEAAKRRVEATQAQNQMRDDYMEDIRLREVAREEAHAATIAAEQAFADKMDGIRIQNTVDATRAFKNERDAYVRELQGRIDAGMRERESRERNLERLRENLDETNVRWKESGLDMEDVIKRWADVSGKSVDEVIDRMLQLNVDTSDVKETLQKFAKDTGGDFLGWADDVKNATDKAARALESATAAMGGHELIAGFTAEELQGMDWNDEEIKKLARIQTGLNEEATKVAAGAGEVVSTAPIVFDDPDPISAATHQGRTVSPEAIDRAVQKWEAWRGVPISFNEQQSIERLQAQGGDFSQLGGNIAQIFAGIPGTPTGLARGGTVLSGGMALVGERGPELVNLPGGAIVHANGTGPGGVVNQFHFHGAVYGVEDLKEAVVEAVRDHALSGGFAGVFAEA